MPLRTRTGIINKYSSNPLLNTLFLENNQTLIHNLICSEVVVLKCQCNPIRRIVSRQMSENVQGVWNFLCRYCGTL